MKKADLGRSLADNPIPNYSFFFMICQVNMEMALHFFTNLDFNLKKVQGLIDSPMPIVPSCSGVTIIRVNQVDILTLPRTWQATIPENYQDEMGHMNVMWYTHLFDRATFSFFDSFGFGADYFHQARSGCFALTQHTRYLAELHVGESVSLYTRALGRSVKRLHFMHFLLVDADQRLSATCEYLATHVDLTVRRSSPLPPHLAEAFDRWVEQHRQLPWDPPLCGVIQP